MKHVYTPIRMTEEEWQRVLDTDLEEALRIVECDSDDWSAYSSQRHAAWQVALDIRKRLGHRGTTVRDATGS